MILLPFEKLPEKLKNDEVKCYYDILYKKRFSLLFKRIMDVVMALILIVILILPMLVICVCIKCTSKGPVLYKQQRITTYGRTFNIFKFRTMTVGADKAGALVTSKNDSRITSIGSVLRKFRLDELPQIFHVLSGKMSLVGTRPEVKKYVDCYTPAMYATLLTPAGITSLASIKFKDEDKIIGEVNDASQVDEIYVNKVLPEKMKYNLEYLEEFSFFKDLYLMIQTVIEVIK